MAGKGYKSLRAQGQTAYAAGYDFLTMQSKSKRYTVQLNGKTLCETDCKEVANDVFAHALRGEINDR